MQLTQLRRDRFRGGFWRWHTRDEIRLRIHRFLRLRLG